MDEFKALTQSKTFWGAIVVMASSLLGVGHYSISAADQTSLVELCTSIASATGGIVAIVGRIAASKQIGSFRPPAAVILLAIGLTAMVSPQARAGDEAQAFPPKPIARTPDPAAVGKISQAQAQKNPILVLQKFAVADLQAALADAQSQTPPDDISAPCYQALITLLANPIASPLPSGPGAFQLIQKGRDLKNALASLQSNNGPLTPLAKGCAPLILDGQNTLIQLGIMTGAVIGAGSIGLPLPIPLGNADGPWLAFQQARDAMPVTARQQQQ